MHIHAERKTRDRVGAVRSIFLVLVLIGGFLGCRDALTTPSISDGSQDPNTYLTRNGALALTRNATQWFSSLVRGYTIYSGLITDELSNSTENANNSLDRREYLEAEKEADPKVGQFYGDLNGFRGQSRIARGALAEYASDLSPAVRGQLFAFEGYAELWLADLYCSGIPLSTLDYKADFTFGLPLPTTDVYAHAVTLFDSALTLVADSPAVKTLAAVGKGRALLSMGKYDEAAMAVENVAANDVYQVRQLFGHRSNYFQESFARLATVSDNEGQNGLSYRSSGDPRTRSDAIQAPVSASKTTLIYFPTKFNFLDSIWFPLASGIEAELIKAEAALHRNQPTVWLSTLNALRTDGTYSEIVGVDTIWNAGSGGVTRLPPLRDPVNTNDRIDLLFAERAAWLFFTGKRQADLRRLVLVYGRSSETVYPTGPYPGSSGQWYGNDNTIPIPYTERKNPNYHGCLSRD